MRSAAGTVAAVLALAAAAVAVVPQPAVAASTSGCAPVTVYVNTGGSGQTLLGYDTTGAPASSAPLPKDYGDIAFDRDGTVLYGITFGPAGTTALDTLDAVTGALLQSRTITGTIASEGQVNGLSSLPDGSLLAGSYNSRTLYRIDPSTAVSTSLSTALPVGTVSAGDFLTLGDGDVLALVNESSAAYSSMVRLHPDGSSTLVGRLTTRAYGMAQVAGRIYIAESTGRLLSTNIPPDTASTATIPATTLANSGLAYFGATSVQDAGACNALASSSSSATYPAGAPVVLTVSGLSSRATGTVAFRAGSTPLCTVTLPATSCTTPPLAPGTYTATGTYSANGQKTTTTFTVLPAPSSSGLAAQTVTLTGPASVPLSTRTTRVVATTSGDGAVTYASSDPSVATVDGAGVVTLRTTGTVTIIATAAATSRYDSSSATLRLEVVGAPLTSLTDGATRLAGNGRVDTSVQVSRALFPDRGLATTTDVVIATSATFADAIAGARLAGQLQAPLLLTPRDALDPGVAAEVRRVARSTGTVYLLGQEAALSADVERALRERSPGYAVQRVGGADRFETAVAVAGVITARTGDASPVYVVTGDDFPDGVCVGPYAQRTGGVVLLTDGSALPETTAAYLRAHDPSGARTVVVGGAAAEAQRRTGTAPAGRVVGADRFETAALLARQFGALPTAGGAAQPVTTVGVAGGDAWPDALAGAAAMSHVDGPLLLTADGSPQLPAATREALDAFRPGAARAVVFGGTAPVPDSVVAQVAALVRH